MLVNIHAAKCIGIDAVPVTVEVNIASGIGIHLVGLADTAVKESLLRTITAMQSLGYRIPGKKVVINLAPADIHKNGSGYDLPIAIGIMAASGQIEIGEESRFLIMGELGLDGSVRNVTGGLPMAELAFRQGYTGCIFPKESAMEAFEYHGTEIYGIEFLDEAIEILKEGKRKAEFLISRTANESGKQIGGSAEPAVDFSDIIGQNAAKRGAEIAAAGGHNILLIGPPGSGKSTLAKAIQGIMPPMSREESIQTSKIYSVAGKTAGTGLMTARPFRSPHHSISVAGLIGGGHENIVPGEISLAHNGILFLDEFCEMPQRIAEALRDPMEDRKITISRLRSKISFPASFMLVAATNPCPCGYYGEGDKCTCSPTKRMAYISRLSGPMTDRMDLHIWMPSVPSSCFTGVSKGEKSVIIAARVEKARAIQRKRFMNEGISTNSEMTTKIISRYCALSAECRGYLRKIMDGNRMSARAYFRIIRIARTIADLEGSDEIDIQHLSEAVSYRFLDKNDLCY